MPYDLQKAPRALLSLFQIKSLGRNPDTFGSEVVPMSEVTDHYLVTQLERSSASGAVTNNGDSVSIAVPQGEVWRIRAVDGVLQIAAATTAADGPGLSVGISLISASATMLASLQLPPKGAAYAASRNLRVTTGWLARPLIAQPGSTVFAFNDALLSAATTAALTVLFERLDP